MGIVISIITIKGEACKIAALNPLSFFIIIIFK